MSAPDTAQTPATSSSDQRLSKMRVAIAIAAVAGLAAVGVFGFGAWSRAQSPTDVTPWFAGYVDVTATPTYAFETPVTEAGREVMLSFIVADENDGCVPTWGNAYTMDEAADALDLDRRIARLRQQGGEVGISFGGLNNDELATSCTDSAALENAYTSVLDRYDVSTIDLDIEANDLADERAGERRAEAIAAVQAERRAAGDSLAVWVTLPAATFGLTEEGTTAVTQLLEAGVDLAGLNVMTMNFGASRETGETMAEASIRTLEQSHRQLRALYALADIELSDGTLWQKLGATPMIGQNDNRKEVFETADAVALNAFATENGVGRMSMWSLNRDQTCGPNYVDLKRVSDSCSGIDQGDDRFADLLSVGFDGHSLEAASSTTSPEPVNPEDIVDDPGTSPYPIWDEDNAYLQGTKIVWHRNVYEAKWWTRGELPDNPVLNEWETPWTLVGPVLPGEKPIEAPTLPSGTYPEWSGTVIFEKGDRVLFDGVPYEAKWWNQGESPEATSSDPDSSPWVALTAKEIAEVIASQ